MMKNIIKRTTTIIRNKYSTEKIIKEKVIRTLEQQNGILFGIPNIVYRNCYVGNNYLLPNNDSFEKSNINNSAVDYRGYLPVERWIFSTTQAINPIEIENEGLSMMKLLENDKFYVKDIIDNNDELNRLLFGEYFDQWPLIKILDIGGDSGIPCHIHSGMIEDGGKSDYRNGKLEAYFFPPIIIGEEKEENNKVYTRLGIKSNTSKEEFIKCVEDYGKNDNLYDLLNLYEINEFDCWHIPEGIVHAPANTLTLEIQLPQDDYNLLSSIYGKRIENEEERKMEMNSELLKGLKSVKDIIDIVNWEDNIDTCFKERFYNHSKLIENGEFGEIYRIFFHQFYGEAIILNSEWTRIADINNQPFCGIVWNGEGLINDQNIKKDDEFFVPCGTQVTFKPSIDETLIIFTFFPFDKEYK